MDLEASKFEHLNIFQSGIFRFEYFQIWIILRWKLDYFNIL